MKKKTKNRMGLLLLVMIVAIPVLPTNSETSTLEPFFSFDLLAPNTCGSNFAYIVANIIIEELPKIGISIETFDHTDWNHISPRTWGYPGPYPIPEYDDGGYDTLLVGWSWGLDWDPTGLFDSPSITPSGDNFYQYYSTEMDWAIANYTSTYELSDRIEWCKEIQALLYEDLPQITIIYPTNLYTMDPNFDTASWSGLLWALEYQPMENWSITGETEFHYATPADFEDFHIYKYESVYDAQWLRQIYNGLVERDPTNNNGYSPRIANNITTTDGLNYSITLNPNVKWADGTTLNASDVEFSYQLQVTPEFNSPDYSYWVKYLDNSSVEIIDEFELNISFRTPYMFQDGNLALDLVPKHIWKDIPFADMDAQAVTWANDDTLDEQKIIGAGPYYLYDYDSTNGVIHLKANTYFDDWSGITPNFDDVYFEFYSNKEGALSALAAGTIDMVDTHFSVKIDEVPNGTKYESVEDGGTQELAINNFHPILGTGEDCPIAGKQSANYVRKAINHALPRDRLNEIYDRYIFNPGVTACPQTAVGFDESLEPYEYNLDLARQYMEEAGYEYSPGSPTIGLAINFGIIFLITSFVLLGGSIIYLKKQKSNGY